MNPSLQKTQKRLLMLGFWLPKYGADGDYGDEADDAFNAALDQLEKLRSPADAPTTSMPPPVPTTTVDIKDRVIPATWMPDAKFIGIVFHWTAGQNKASDLDRSHYHLLIESDGKHVRGVPSIDLNSLPKAKAGYAAHTLNCNTGFIGVSLCGMAGAVESPFRAGKQPITRVQWDELANVLAQLCKRYGIKVSRKTVLSHAEVQTNLGIKQKGKWDIARLPFDTSIQGAAAIGDQMRAMVQSKL
ncbi:N-acetylmuramoyl-L-alanine amidase [Rhizobium sp. CFBP 13726]|uniref:peptidoglycan recognition protein family protein n=1 Tax=Rhizobium sp. CFBP 13726 TaxID=2775296 RepID=UPI00177F3A2A|nr:peptidoglycan recognition family protein [Rhizobium sp. CFBP 13726]MBD8651469.1 N-acetylmuramoyl-L-alanine amidase [Rhizobium sp. CFBP 13726]